MICADLIKIFFTELKIWWHYFFPEKTRSHRSQRPNRSEI